MEHPQRSFRLQRSQCILVSALLGTATMISVLFAAIAGAPEAAFVGICAGGFAAMLVAAIASQFCR